VSCHIIALFGGGLLSDILLGNGQINWLIIGLSEEVAEIASKLVG